MLQRIKRYYSDSSYLILEMSELRNSIRTIPYLVDWNEKYADKGLVIVGIHASEFEFEKNINNVKAAVKNFGIKYPVIQDNDKGTWNAYENRYWPRKYIVDNEGYIRYDHIGEGGYAETERVIQSLLQERYAQLGLDSGLPSSNNNTLMETTTTPENVQAVDFSKINSPELYFFINLPERLWEIQKDSSQTREREIEC